jgi:hypothetical protein
MKRNYKTGKLPPNFFYLGIMLLGIGIWRMIALDWNGILFFLISLLCLFIKSGIIIDTDKRKLKKYIGFFVIRKGEWENINSLTSLQIIRIKETQSMSVLSISRTEINEVYKLILALPDRKIELMSGERKFIIKAAKEISKELQTSVLTWNKYPES